MSIQRDGIKKSRLKVVIVILVFSAILVIPAQPAEIHGQKWNDIDGDGVRDVDESGISGILIACNPPPYIGPFPGPYNPYNATTLTDSLGNYVFTEVPEGTYEIAEDIPSG